VPDFNEKDPPVAAIETGLDIISAFERSDGILAEEDTCIHNSIKTSSAVVAKGCFLLIIDKLIIWV